MQEEFEPARYKRILEEAMILESVKKSLARPKSRWEHPLTLLIVSFGLTGIVGAAISISFQSMQGRENRNAHEYEGTTKAIAAFSDSLYKRYVWGTFLYSSIKRGAEAEEVKARKKEYDAALVGQESTLLSTELLIRQGLKSAEYNDFEAKYDQSVRLRLKMLDNALTQMTHDYLRDTQSASVGTPIEKQLDCVKRLFPEVVNCNYAICNSVFLAVSSKAFTPLHGGQTITAIADAWQNFEAQCPTPRSPADYSVSGCEYLPRLEN